VADRVVADRCECEDSPKPDFVLGPHHGGPTPLGMDCEQPNGLIYPCCGIFQKIPCDSTKSHFCKPCARRYRRRVRKVAEIGLMRVREKQAFVITLTAPTGRSHCKRRDHPGCRGRGPTCKPCECTIEGFDVGVWNASHSERKNDFLTALRRGEASKLQDGKRRHLKIEYFGGVEAQDGKRGGSGRMALHDHLICVADRGVTFSASAVRKLAIAHGFGHELVVDVLPLDGAKHEKAARYCGKIAAYVGKACDERALVPWRAAGEDPHKGRQWRAWTRSRGWACSMAEVRGRRRQQRADSMRTDESDGFAGACDGVAVAFNGLTSSYAEDRAPPDTETPLIASQGVLFRWHERKIRSWAS
jgi:hypothetical protein